jgi:cytochrome c oxidase cbb3-type subunit 1
MQFLVNGWFAAGLFSLWLGALSVAILYYFIPKLTAGQAVYSRSLAALGFWSFAVFAPWMGLYRGVPLPAWVVSASIAAAVMTLVPLAANVINLWESRRGGALVCSRIWVSTGLVFFAISGVLTALVALCPISALTVVVEAGQVLAMYGSIGFTLFGAIYYIAPRLLLGETVCGTRGKVTWWCTFLGILFFSGALLIGGLVQGRKLLDGSVTFVTVMNSLKPFLRISTVGLLLLLVGNVSPFCQRAPDDVRMLPQLLLPG